MQNKKLRNVAIIAHVDHGKTTLVDKIIFECNVLKKNKGVNDLILDNNELERERGITILSKNVSVFYKNIKINIIDTPGHADFGGEVERVLKMADGVLLLVDAFEGPMPQTRFVLDKALKLNLKPIVVVNKVDKQNCNPDWVNEMVFDLMYALGATEEQLNFTTIYGSSKYGWMSSHWKTPTQHMEPLLDAIISDIPPPNAHDGITQMQITSLDYSSFVGRIAIGKVSQGSLISGNSYSLCKKDDTHTKVKIKELHTFEGLEKRKVDKIEAGDICAITGIEGFEIGDTISDVNDPKPLPRIKIDSPTMSMNFKVNDSPFFGQEGKFITSRHVRNRLYKETEKNLALKVEDTQSEDTFTVFGRGILHLSILIETMRREGYEFMVGQPQVLFKKENEVLLEPLEQLIVELPEPFAGQVIEMVSKRKGNLKRMEPKADVMHLEFEIPSRGIIGLRNTMLTTTAGKATMYHRFLTYTPFVGTIQNRINGSLISMDKGMATAYTIDKLQDRGRFFVAPGDNIYEGQVVGEHTKGNDLVVNLQKGKKLTNIRAAGSDSNTTIVPKTQFSLEEALEYIQNDEYLEITPKSVRMRKILLTENERKRNKNTVM